MAFLIAGMLSAPFHTFGFDATWTHASGSTFDHWMLTTEKILFDRWMLYSVLFLAALGIVYAYLLKPSSAIEKDVASGGAVALLIAQAFMPNEPGLSLLTIECALVIVLGGLAYHLSLSPSTSTQSSTPLLPATVIAYYSKQDAGTDGERA